MNEPLISVIVPVYNVEHYIKRCVDSILAQTYTNLEIILVDDGSTDNSGKICDEYAMTDLRVRVIHIDNNGQSEARNLGMNKAKGYYFAFVDSDDYIAIDYISYLYEIMQIHQAQISICGYCKIGENNSDKKDKKIILDKETKVYDSKEGILQLLYQRGILTVVWGRLFKAELFREINFPKGKLHEDVAVLYKLFDIANKIACGDQKKYFYFQRVGSTMNKRFYKQRMDYLEFTKECIQYMNRNHPRLTRAAISRHFSACFDLLSCIGNDKKIFAEEYLQIVQEIRKYRKTVLLDSNARLKNRLAAAGSYVSIMAIQKLSCLLKRP